MESDITVNGLAEGTTVKVYAIVTLNEAGNDWVVADWAKTYVTKSTEEGVNAYVIDEKDYKNLQDKASDEYLYDEVESSDGTSVTFEDVPIGAYLILATHEDVTYSVMIANTYDFDSDTFEAVDRPVTAKTSNYTVGKVADDDFIARGQTVTFTVTTIYPTFDIPDSEGNSYKIVDTPTGLEITGVTSVKIGDDTELTEEIDYTAGYNDNNTDYTIDLTKTIGNENENAGKTVTVVYTAIVTSDEGYSNTVNACRNEETLGKGDTTVEGHTGILNITKMDDGGENAKALTGAKFKLLLGEEEEVIVVYDDTNKVYKVATPDEIKDEKVDTGAEFEVDTDGKVTVKGLGDGTYTVVETVAPAGYSINSNIPAVEIGKEEGNDANVTVDINVTDTKLSSLPSTGGIGTTIFTIGGIILMVGAAGMYFVSKKKKA